MRVPWFGRRKTKDDKYEVPEDLYVQRPDVISLEDNATNKERSALENSTQDTHNKSHDEAYDLTSNVLGLVHNTKSYRGIDAVHAFMALNLEDKGYGDAFRNSDSSHMNAAMQSLYQDLKILIARALSYYEDTLKDQAFHKSTRQNLGMADLAKEIEAEENKINDLLIKLKKIDTDAAVDKGKSLRVITSYEIGFKNALSVITRSKLLNDDSNKIVII